MNMEMPLSYTPVAIDLGDAQLAIDQEGNLLVRITELPVGTACAVFTGTQVKQLYQWLGHALRDQGGMTLSSSLRAVGPEDEDRSGSEAPADAPSSDSESVKGERICNSGEP